MSIIFIVYKCLFQVVVWKRVVIFIPASRVPEMHFLLRSFNDADILFMRRQGRLVWERYFASLQAIIDTIIAVMRDRLGLPPRPCSDIAAPTYPHDSVVNVFSTRNIIIFFYRNF